MRWHRCDEFRRRLPLAALVLAAGAALGASVPSSASQRADSAARLAPREYVAILWDPATPVGERRIWTVYLYTRAALLASESGRKTLPLGVRAPSFDGEVRARRVAVGLFRQLERDDPDFGSRYFDDLDQVEAAGFLREYVWRYLRQPTWAAPPAGLKLAEFDAWRAVHLRYHVPVTHGEIEVRLGAATR